MSSAFSETGRPFGPKVTLPQAEQMGVDYINTDRPAAAAAFLRDLKTPAAAAGSSCKRRH